MSFSLFRSFNPLVATLNIPQNNDSKPMNPIKNKSLLHKQSIIVRENALLSTPINPNHSKNQTSISTDDITKRGILKHDLREIEDPWECLNFIDATQRLGIDYHFEEEIEAVLQRQYLIINNNNNNNNNTLEFRFETHDLYKAALLFRLLRQQGYLVSSDVFEAFLDKKGKFKEELREDIKGLTSLYEASKLCMHGDEILEEAEKFSSHWLNERAQQTMDDDHDHNLANFVHNTLAYPHHTSVAQFMVPNYLQNMNCPNQWIHIFQDAAKMELFTNQRLRQNEIAQFLKWWKETDLAKDLEFARDQPTKWYIASMVCLTDSLHSQQRLQLAKSISFIYLIDDLFDVFGTLEELTLFTQAVHRWDLGPAEGLPDCMRICLSYLFQVTEEISYNIYQIHGWNPIHSLHKAWAKLCKAFLVEAEWLSCEQSPSADEYLKNGVVSTGVHVTLIHVFFLLGQQINHQTAQLFEEDLDIVSSTATVLRLWDDMGSAKDEEQVGKDGSYLEYYMKENPNISYEETQQHTMNKISDAWKTLNRECLTSNQFPAKFTQSCLNVARVVPMAYNYGRNQSITSLENLIQKLLFHGRENM